MWRSLMPKQNQVSRQALRCWPPAACVIVCTVVTGTAYAQTTPALPINGQVVAGQATINAPVGNSLVIGQQSQNAAINWQNFNIGRGATVTFAQPGTSSVTLNRVLGQDPSTILGNLTANGQVFILNPNGVLFGKGAQVNVGGLVASTHSISDENFMSGHYTFTNEGAKGKVVNAGEIVANGGYVALIGSQVKNRGTITATNGSVALAAGEQVSVHLNGNTLVGLTVDQGTLNALATNGGLIKADGGMVILTAKAADALIKSVVNNHGTIEANTLKNVGGAINLVAEGGEARVSGTVNASAATSGKGGDIAITGDRVVLDKAAVSANGADGGGRVRVGGGWQGKDVTISNAQVTTISSGTRINADATGNGSGGTVVAWSEKATKVVGQISARGGAQGGNGGQIETSSRGSLTVGGAKVDARAPLGRAGQWLMDPTSVTISGGAGAASNTIYESDIESAGADVLIQATDSIITSGIFGSSDVVVPSGLNLTIRTTAAGGGTGIDLTASANGAALEFKTSGGGSVSMSTGNTAQTINTSNITVTGAGTITLNSLGPLVLDTVRLQTAGGAIALNGAGTTLDNGVKLSDATVSAGAGMVTLTGSTTTASFGITIERGFGAGSLVTGGTINLNGSTASGTASVLVNRSTVQASNNLVVNGAGGTVSSIPTDVYLQGATLTAANNLDITGKITTDGSATGTVTITAGMNTGNVLTLNSAVSTLDATTNVSKLIGKKLSTTSAIGAGALTITTTSDIGSAGTPLVTSANSLKLQGADVFVTNGKSLSLEASTASGRFLLDNGANDVTLAGTLTANGTGDGIRIASKNFINNAGASALSAPNGRWVVWSTTPANNMFGGLQSGNGAIWSTAFNSSSPSIASTGNRFVFSGAQPVNANAVVRADDKSKTYGDTFNPANFTFTATTSDLGALYGNAFTAFGSVSLSGTPILASTGALNTATRIGGVGGSDQYAITVDLTGVTATVGGISASLSTQSGVLTVGRRAVTVTSDAQSVSYGGSAAPLTFTAANLAGFDNNAGAFSGALTRAIGANSGAGIERAGSYAITQGTLAANSNYTLSTFTGSMYTVTPLGLSVTGAVAASRIYDTTAVASIGGGALAGKLAGDTVSLGGAGAGIFADKNVGTAKAVAVSGYTLGGTDAGNYSITQPTGLTANISKASVTVSGITAISRVYDATTVAGLVGTATVTALGADNLTVGGAGAGRFADKNVGTAKAVTVTGYTLGGADAGNYSITQPTGLTANISKTSVTVSGVTAISRAYDATTVAGLAGTAIVTALGADNLTVGGAGAGIFADKNVGTAKAVAVSGYTLGGTDAGNYSITQPTGLTANISKASVTVSGITAISRVYDATTVAGLAGTATVTALGADNLTVGGAGAGRFADKNVGTAKAVTVTGYTLGGADAGSYSITQPTGLTANITPGSLVVTANNATTIYGSAIPPFTASYNDFAFSDGPDSLTGALAFSLPPNANFSPGDFSITPSGLLSKNYTITYIDGVLTVTGSSQPLNETIASIKYQKSDLAIPAERHEDPIVPQRPIILQGSGVRLPLGVN
jgi:filamentous hemagglutinin family protein